jgi:signal transduction histidine kinase
MDMYEKGIKDSKLKIENEYALQNSTSNKIRNYLILGMMILMFLASILIIYLTRISFVYETKLNAANIQINENLNFKNRILGMLSHELRAPLKIIGIFIKKINKKVDDETVKGYLKSISFTNETLLMQSNLILEYTKNQHAKNSLNLEIFDLKKEVESIAIALEPYIETRNNTFTIQNNVPENLLINSDSKKINQLFINILGNANKFTENGKIHATISTENIKNNKVLLSVSIKDNGVGISKSDLENIFKPYYQGILSEDVENLGAGLGLSLCKEIVELYEGEISVSSEQNAGTTVNFSLYLAKYDGK